MESIPLILVLGFLGSGKTSFIKHLLHTDMKNRNPAIIQNEFAPASIDSEEIRHEEETVRILEINGGSVFCACRIDNFIPALSDFISDSHPGILILEASGISDPLSLIEILTAPALKEKISYAGSVCLADARQFVSLQKMNVRVREQIRIADIVLLNKTDLSTPEEISASEKLIRELNPFCLIKHTSYGRTDFIEEELRNTNNYFILNAQKPSGPSGLKTGVIRSVKKISTESLDTFLNLMIPHTIRLKGFVNLDNGKTVMVQAVGEERRVEEYASYSGPSQLIAIGSDLDPRAFSAAFRNS